MMDKEELALNAKLQQKKNNLRKKLAAKGMLQKQGNNDFDHYKYFSEAQYKLLFTDLFSETGLELKFSEICVAEIQGTQKQMYGRRITFRFTLMDIETGYGEESVISGEAFDKSDKAGYKAYTGAYKYYLANTFGVATGDDPEVPDREIEKPAQKQNQDPKPNPMRDPGPETVAEKITDRQIMMLSRYYQGPNMEKLLKSNGITRIADMPKAKASELITKVIERTKQKEAQA